MPDLPTMTRRDVVRLTLAAGATAAVVACTRQSGGEPGPTSPGGPEDPDRALRAEVGRAETTLSALYAQVAAGLGSADAARITALGARHEAYRQAIDPDRLADLPPPGSPTPTSTTGSASASPSSSPKPSSTPITPVVAARRLRAAEAEAARARVSQAGRATDPELARVIVLAGAGAAGAAELLRSGTP